MIMGHTETNFSENTSLSVPTMPFFPSTADSKPQVGAEESSAECFHEYITFAVILDHFYKKILPLLYAIEGLWNIFAVDADQKLSSKFAKALLELHAYFPDRVWSRIHFTGVVHGTDPGEVQLQMQQTL